MGTDDVGNICVGNTKGHMSIRVFTDECVGSPLWAGEGTAATILRDDTNKVFRCFAAV